MPVGIVNAQGQTEMRYSPKLDWTEPFFKKTHLELWEMLGWVFCGKTIAVIGDDMRAQTGALQHRLERQQSRGG